MMQHTAATMALHRDRELRVILTEARGKRKVELRTFSPPVTPANIRATEREGLTITVGELPDLIEALQAAAFQAGEMGWAEEPGSILRRTLRVVEGGQ